VPNSSQLQRIHVRKLMKPSRQNSVTRREFLWRYGGGLGGIAMAHLLGRHGLLAGSPQPRLISTAACTIARRSNGSCRFSQRRRKPDGHV
jgi:hypothetical protein